MSKKKDTVAILVSPTKALRAKLDALAQRYKRESGNQVMIEIAELYSDLWTELEKAKEDMLKQQWERTVKMLTRPLYPAEADGESTTKPQAQGKKGRK